jgi:triosephosphate isomerase
MPMTSRRPLVAANWKMNGSRGANAAWLVAFAARAGSLACDVVVCPPFVYMAEVLQGLAGAELGAQDVSEWNPGAYTGDVAVQMLRTSAAAGSASATRAAPVASRIRRGRFGEG